MRFLGRLFKIKGPTLIDAGGEAISVACTEHMIPALLISASLQAKVFGTYATAMPAARGTAVAEIALPPVWETSTTVSSADSASTTDLRNISIISYT